VQPCLNLRIEQPLPAAPLTSRRETGEEARDRRADLDDGRTGLREGDRAARSADKQATADRVEATHDGRASRMLGPAEAKQCGSDPEQSDVHSLGAAAYTDHTERGALN